MLLSEALIILFLVMLNGVLAGAEIAVVAVRDTRLRELSEKGSRSARAVLALRSTPERFLATVQVGISVISATAGAFGGAAFAEDLAPFIAPLPGIGAYARELSFAAVVLLVSYLSLVLGELVPKSLALRSSESYSLIIARPLLGLSRVAQPLIWFLTASSNVVLRIFGDRTSFVETRLSAAELRQLLEDASRVGSVHPKVARIASQAFDLAALTAADAMVPRERVVAVSRTAPADELNALLKQRYWRVPVFDGSIDNIIGYVSQKDLQALERSGHAVELDSLIRPAYFVFTSTKAIDVLTQMQKRKAPLAVVMEERGGFAGIVTVEDLLKDLVGELAHDAKRPGPIERGPGRSVTVLGTVSVRDLNRQLGFALPDDGDYTTIAGLCVVLTGRIPPVGTTIVTPQGYTLEVVDASSRRIRGVRIHPPNAA